MAGKSSAGTVDPAHCLISAMLVILLIFTCIPGQVLAAGTGGTGGAGQTGRVVYSLLLWNNLLVQGNVREKGYVADPVGMAYDPVNNCMYVADWRGPASTGYVEVVSCSTNALVATIPVGIDPYAVVFAGGLGRVLVTNFASNSVSEINPSTNGVVSNIQLPSNDGASGNLWGPVDMAYDSGNSTLYVGSGGFGNHASEVTAVDMQTGRVVKEIVAGNDSQGMIFDSVNGMVYVANAASGNISIIDTKTVSVIGSIAVGGAPSALSFDATNGVIYAATSSSAGANSTYRAWNNISVIYSGEGRVAEVIPVSHGNVVAGSTFNSLLCIPQLNEVCELNYWGGNLSVVNLATGSVSYTLELGMGPFGVGLCSRTGLLYASNSISASISVVALHAGGTGTLTEIIPFTVVLAAVGCTAAFYFAAGRRRRRLG